MPIRYATQPVRAARRTDPTPYGSGGDPAITIQDRARLGYSLQQPCLPGAGRLLRVPAVSTATVSTAVVFTVAV